MFKCILIRKKGENRLINLDIILFISDTSEKNYFSKTKVLNQPKQFQLKSSQSNKKAKSMKLQGYYYEYIMFVSIR